MNVFILFLWLPLLCYAKLATGSPPAIRDEVPLDLKTKKITKLNVTENCLSARHLTAEQIRNSRFDIGDSTCFEMFEDFDCSEDALIVTGGMARKFLNLDPMGSLRACKKPKTLNLCSAKLSPEYSVGFATTRAGPLESFNVTSGECQQLPWTMSMDFMMIVDPLENGTCVYLFSSTDCSQPKAQFNSQFASMFGFAPHDVESMQICDCLGESQDDVQVVETEQGLSSGHGYGQLGTVTDTNDAVSSTETENEDDTGIPKVERNPKRR